ncbi:MAG TPA: hypothetical protein VLJ17_24425 [Xanthobacteraceae bacterium]|nr:hypothetical protein [Xanthobacteraceae bacterium]
MSKRTCKKEPHDVARKCIEQMLARQYAETGDNSVPLAPDFNLYRAMEERGSLFVLIVYERESDDEPSPRDDQSPGRPIGYAVGVYHQHPNSVGMMIGTIPTYYVEDGAGRVFIQKAMLEQAALRLCAAGAKRVRIETNPKASNGRMLEKMGYRPIAMTYEIDPSEIQQEKLSA